MKVQYLVVHSKIRGDVMRHLLIKAHVLCAFEDASHDRGDMLDVSLMKGQNPCLLGRDLLTQRANADLWLSATTFVVVRK